MVRDEGRAGAKARDEGKGKRRGKSRSKGKRRGKRQETREERKRQETRGKGKRRDGDRVVVAVHGITGTRNPETNGARPQWEGGVGEDDGVELLGLGEEAAEENGRVRLGLLK